MWTNVNKPRQYLETAKTLGARQAVNFEKEKHLITHIVLEWDDTYRYKGEYFDFSPILVSHKSTLM